MFPFPQGPPRAGLLYFNGFRFGLIDTPSHILHGNLEFLPGPSIFISMDLVYHRLELVEPSFRFLPHEMLSNLVPILLWNLPFLATGLDLVQPCVDGRVFLVVSSENWTISPGGKYRFQVVRLEFERVEHPCDKSVLVSEYVSQNL